MLLVRPEDVGEAAFARMIHGGILLPYGPGLARPGDVPDTLALRAVTVGVRVSADDALTGLGALWLWGWLASPPTRWHSLGGKGIRDRHALWWVRHASGYEGMHHRRLRLADGPRACVDALRWESPEDALPAVMTVLRAGLASAEALTAVAARIPAGPERRRGMSRVCAVVEAASGAALGVGDASRVVDPVDAAHRIEDRAQV